ncbi:MAG: hypothetical protein ACOCXR_00335 [Phototrophicaceae bacterium]
MHVLLIFLDGVGLGDDNPAINPFAAAHLPTLEALSGGQPWTRQARRYNGSRSLFIPTDPRMNVPGRPQSGTGQASIVTGRNVPQLVGEHYGPKPDAATRAIIDEGTIFSHIIDSGRSARLLEAYPPPWHAGITSGKRLPASYQQAAQSAGVPFLTGDHLRRGEALSGDFTGAGWRTQLKIDDIPELTPYQAGVRLVELSRRWDFAFFPHWITDIIGHRGPMTDAITLLETIDGVMRGVFDTWDDAEGLAVLTSDHGNLEDLSHRHHTENDVPTLVIGGARDVFADLHDLAGIAPRIERLFID